MIENLKYLLATLREHGVTSYEGPLENVGSGIYSTVKLRLEPLAARAEGPSLPKPGEPDPDDDEEVGPDGLTRKQHKEFYTQT